MKLIIDRKIWLRGEPEDSKLLRSSDSKRCCLGIYGQACGVPDNKLIDQITPYFVGKNVWTKKRRGGAWLFEEPTKFSDRLVLFRINDTVTITEKKRESLIKKTFAKHGVHVEFIN